MRKLWVCSNSSYMENRIRLAKLKGLLLRESIDFSFVGWLRGDRKEVSDYEVYHPFVTSNMKGIILPMGYLIWSIKLFWFLLWKTSKSDCFYSMGLESAIPAMLISRIKGNAFIFDNPDNFSTSFRLKGFTKTVVDQIERKVAQNSFNHILPSKYRVINPTERDTFIPNTPSKAHIELAKKLINSEEKTDFLKLIETETRFKVYLNGRLVDDRGGDYISDAFEELDPEKFCLVIVGNIDSDKFYEFISYTNLCVYHSNRIPAEESLAAYYFCDVTIALYSPEREINILAESNKWFDSLTMNTSFISNNEILSLKQFASNPLCYKVSYGREKELKELILSLPKKKNLEVNDSLQDWDSRIKPIIQNLLH